MGDELLFNRTQCQCGVETEKLQVFDNNAGGCAGNTDYYPTAREAQTLAFQGSCCTYYSLIVQQEVAATDAEYDSGPTQPVRYCQLYEAAWARIQEESGLCTAADSKTAAEAETKQRLDNGSCQVEQALV